MIITEQRVSKPYLMLMELCLENIWPEPMGDSSQRSVGPPHMHRLQFACLHRYQFLSLFLSEERNGEVRRAGRYVTSCPPPPPHVGKAVAEGSRESKPHWRIYPHHKNDSRSSFLKVLSSRFQTFFALGFFRHIQLQKRAY